MAIYEFLGADSGGIYVRLFKDGKSVDITLPATQDYFEQDDEGVSTSPYIAEHFDDLWDMHTIDGVKKLKAENAELRGLLADTVELLLMGGDY